MAQCLYSFNVLPLRVEKIWSGCLPFLVWLLFWLVNPVLDSSFSVVDSCLLVLNYALWLGLVFAFSLLRILLSFSFDLIRLQDVFQLPKENNFLDHCYHGVASIIISVFSFILYTTIALLHDIEDSCYRHQVNPVLLWNLVTFYHVLELERNFVYFWA